MGRTLLVLSAIRVAPGRMADGESVTCIDCAVLAANPDEVFTMVIGPSKRSMTFRQIAEGMRSLRPNQITMMESDLPADKIDSVITVIAFDDGNVVIAEKFGGLETDRADFASNAPNAYERLKIENASTEKRLNAILSKDGLAGLIKVAIGLADEMTKESLAKSEAITMDLSPSRMKDMN